MSNTNAGFLCGLGAGIGVGLAVGVLFAPRPGLRTRAMLLRTVKDGQEYVVDKQQDLQKAASKLLDRNIKIAKQAADQFAQAFESGRKVILG